MSFQKELFHVVAARNFSKEQWNQFNDWLDNQQERRNRVEEDVSGNGLRIANKCIFRRSESLSPSVWNIEQDRSSSVSSTKYKKWKKRLRRISKKDKKKSKKKDKKKKRLNIVYLV